MTEVTNSMDSGLGIGGLSIGKDEVASSSFDLFSPIEIENSISNATKIVTRPIATTNSRGPFKFVFPADPEKWSNCESLRLSGNVKILRKKDDGSIENFKLNYSEVSTVNNFFQSLFSSVVCTLNGVEITDPSGNWYPYKAYLETLLSYSKSTKEGRLQTTCFYQDDPTKFDEIGAVDQAGKTTTSSSNSGYTFRKFFFDKSEKRYFNIPLHSDICTPRKYLPPNTKLEFEFHRTPDDFSILSPYDSNTCQIHIEDLTLSLTRYTPAPSIRNYHMSQLSKTKRQIIPIDRSLIKTYT